MNEETEEEICAALAIAMDLVPTHFYYFRTVPGDPTRLYASKDAPDKRHSIEFFTDWNATGKLIEWWLKDEGEEISCLYWSIRFRFHVAAICSGTGEDLQTAIVHAIYAGLKEKESENEESETE